MPQVSLPVCDIFFKGLGYLDSATCCSYQAQSIFGNTVTWGKLTIR